MRIFGLLRVRQWYKNLVIFLPILFGQELGDSEALLLTVVGFFSLCFVSSANYIVNDIVDRKADRLHPEKKKRPIASGEVPVWVGLAVCCLLLSAALGIAGFLSQRFLLIVISLFLISQLYTFWLKREPFADVLVIAVLFVLRAVSGAYVKTLYSEPYIWVSPWLILCPFFLSIFLSAAKHEADGVLLKGNASRVLRVYTPDMTRALMVVATSLLVVSYSLFSFLSINSQLLYSLPFGFYVVFRYLWLAGQGSVIARQPEMAVKDLRLVVGGALWLVSVLVLLYGM